MPTSNVSKKNCGGGHSRTWSAAFFSSSDMVEKSIREGQIEPKGFLALRFGDDVGCLGGLDCLDVNALLPLREVT